jgi:hypothetical protein
MEIDPLKRSLPTSGSSAFDAGRIDAEKLKVLFAPSSDDLPVTAMPEADLSEDIKTEIIAHIPNSYLMAALLQQYFKGL